MKTRLFPVAEAEKPVNPNLEFTGQYEPNPCKKDRVFDPTRSKTRRMRTETLLPGDLYASVLHHSIRSKITNLSQTGKKVQKIFRFHEKNPLKPLPIVLLFLQALPYRFVKSKSSIPVSSHGNDKRRSTRR